MSDQVTSPTVLAGVSTTELLTAWQGHVAVLVAARHGLGERPVSVGRLRSTALDALAVGQALADAITTTRWTTCSEALTFGATVDQVATAMGLHADEVVMGLRSWADGQLRHAGMTQAGYDELTALLTRAGGVR